MVALRTPKRTDRIVYSAVLSFGQHHYGTIFGARDLDALADALARQAADPDNPLSTWESWVIIRVCRAVAETDQRERAKTAGMKRLLRDVLAEGPEEEAEGEWCRSREPKSA